MANLTDPESDILQQYLKLRGDLHTVIRRTLEQQSKLDLEFERDANQ